MIQVNKEEWLHKVMKSKKEDHNLISISMFKTWMIKNLFLLKIIPAFKARMLMKNLKVKLKLCYQGLF